MIAAPPGGFPKLAALLGAATAALYGLALAVSSVPCVAILAAVAVVAWPIWRYRREFALFERRAILSGVLREESRVRRVFWRGHVAVTRQGIAAFAWAAALLAIAASMGPWHWLVLAADALVVAFLAPRLARRLAVEVRDEQVGLAVRRWPLRWINVAALAIAFFAVDYFVAGAPDTRGLAWAEVADHAFRAASGGVPCSLAGAVLGAVAAVDALAWHAAQVLIPALAEQGMRVVAWAVFLLQAGVVASAFTRVQLGLLAEIDRRTPEPGALRSFMAALLLVAAGLALAAWVARGVDRDALGRATARLVEGANPCRTDTAAVAALRGRLDGALAKVRADEQARTVEAVDAALAPIFAEAAKGVDAYLDWYFSVFGEYQRLISSQLPELMDRKLQEHVFGEGFDARIAAASQAITEASAARVAEAAGALGGTIAASARSHPCLPERLDLEVVPAIERDAMRATTAAAGGVAVAVAARTLGRATAVAAMRRVAAKPVYRGAASLGGRMVAKRAGSAATGGVTGLACGPAAPICSLVLAGLAWISFDTALVAIDEALMRPQMREEILDSLREQERELAAQLHDVQRAAIDRSVDAANRSLDRVFIPARS